MRRRDVLITWWDFEEGCIPSHTRPNKIDIEGTVVRAVRHGPVTLSVTLQPDDGCPLLHFKAANFIDVNFEILPLTLSAGDRLKFDLAEGRGGPLVSNVRPAGKPEEIISGWKER